LSIFGMKFELLGNKETHMRALLISLFFCSVVFAHGGTYYGPQGGGTPGYNGPIGGGTVGPQPGGTTPTPVTGGTTPPPTAGGATPPSPVRPRPATPSTNNGRGFGGTTPKGRAKSNSQSWDWSSWWSVNDDEFLSIRSRVLRGSDTESKDTFLGGGGDLHDSQSVTLRHIRKSILPSLIKGLNDPYYDARAAAAVALGKISGDSSSVEKLGSLLKDEDYRVREAACIGLGLTKNYEALGYLKNLLEEENINARLKFFASIAYSQIISSDESKSFDHVSFLIKSSKVKSPNVDSSLGFIIGFSLLHDDLSKAYLESICKDENADQMIRAYAAISLGKRKSYSSLPFVYSLLLDKSSLVSSSAVISLGHLVRQEDTDKVSALIRIADSHPDRNTRNFAMISLGRIGGGRSQAALISHIVRGQYDDLTFSSLGLAMSKDHNEDIGKFLSLVYSRSKDSKAKSAVAIALGLLRYTPFRETILKDLEDETNTSLLRGYLCISAGMLGLSDAEGSMINLLKQKGDLDAKSMAAIGLGLINSVDAIPQIVTLMSESQSNKSNLANLTLSLGYIGDARAIPPLTSFMSENMSDSQRAFSLVSLGILGDKDLIPALSVVQKDSNYTSQTQGLAELLTIL
jgi:HEAT repeat protein